MLTLAAKTHWPALYRHAVLHGESVDYGTEINSLKAISLLQYVSGVLARDATAADAA